MHKLLDRLDHIQEEMKSMQHGFADLEKYALDTLKKIAQNILKKTYETEKSTVSANLENRQANLSAIFSMILNPNSTGTDNLFKMAAQGESRRDSRLKNMYLAYHSTLKKIKNMNVQEIFEFLDTFSKKDLHGMVVPRVIVAKPIPKRIEVKLVPVKN